MILLLKYIYKIVVIVVISLVSCKETTKYTDITSIKLSDFSDIIPLAGDIHRLDSLNNPFRLYSTEDKLIFIDLQGTHHLKIFDKLTKQFITKAIPIGYGPNEAAMIGNVQVCSNGQAWLYDPQIKSLLNINLKGLDKTNDSKITKQVKIKDRGCRIPVVTKNGSIIATSASWSPYGRFLNYDIDGNVIDAIGEYHFLVKKLISDI